MAENENQANQGAANAAPGAAQKKVLPAPKKTWQEKLDTGEPLTDLEDVKAEADFAVNRHIREQKERARFEARKNRSLRRPQGDNGGAE